MRQLNLWPDYMTTGSIDGISYVLPRAGVGNYSAIQAYIAKYLNNDPRTYENSSFIVYNATGEKGVAAAEKERLEEAGYTVTKIGNTEAKVTDKYTLYVTNNDNLGTRDMLEKFYDLRVKMPKEIPEGVPKDHDFILIIGPSPVEEETEGEESE